MLQERDEASASARVGLHAERHGGKGEWDVVAAAALGDCASTVVVECTTAAPNAKATDIVRDTFAAEAGTMRDRVNAEYAVLLGPTFARREPLDAEPSRGRLCRLARRAPIKPSDCTSKISNQTRIRRVR